MSGFLELANWLGKVIIGFVVVVIGLGLWWWLG